MYSKELDASELEKLASSVKRIEEIIKDYIGAYKEISDIHNEINNLVVALFRLVDIAKGNTTLSYIVSKLSGDYFTVYLCLDRENRICVSKDFNVEVRLVDIEKAMVEVAMSNAFNVVIEILYRLASILDRLDVQVMHKLLSIAESS